ncbi:unnamed protein product, partial [Brenthis ino]
MAIYVSRELKLDKDRVPVVSVIDKHTVTITNIKVSVSGAGDSRERVRRYYADYTFDGACAPAHPAYASQEVIFDTLGREVLSTISKGQSACVLTYGQSATGKTHTMMGSVGQLGLIPRICKALADEQLFDTFIVVRLQPHVSVDSQVALHVAVIQSHVSHSLKHLLKTCSFLEIYNERVHDLLAGEPNLPLNSLPRRKGNARKDLRVREHPTKGTYVQNLRRVTVNDVESLLAIVHEGTRKRRTAATKRNSASSRSHALLELKTSRATLHLADLAGSEKAGWEGAGGRQKEGANINKSLVALSNVISALVSGESGRRRFVPYRDSALTWLLKDCFTGGGSTFIVATVSPSVACYGESASTLRWASRARRLPDTRTNTSNTNTKATLQTQFDAILAELGRHYIQYKPETGELLYDDKHWTLEINKIQGNILNKKIKIGNIMNLRYPKNEADNSGSTPSLIASGSLDVINNMDKNGKITNEINKEIDKLFGPALERTKSGTDIEVIAPLRDKKRHFRSQEILSSDFSERNLDHRFSDVGINEGKVEDCINKTKTSQVTALHNNQRAEIIASVTERLYSKLKKNENASKVESMSDKKLPSELKIMQPLKELKICSNARQRLMELSKKALKNKRRMGIPAHTQTRKTVIRVKDQAIEIQTDLQPYIIQQKYPYKFQQDVSTETTSMTPRVKEIAVGSKYSSLSFADKFTLTESKKVSYTNTSTITDTVSMRSFSTQTPKIQPPPRRKKRLSAYSKYIKKVERSKSSTDESNENSISPIININISPMYAVNSDSNSSDEVVAWPDEDKHSAATTPDLLTNHSNMSKKSIENEENCNDLNLNIEYLDKKSHSVDNLDEFSDVDLPMPRVTVDSARKIGRKDYEDLIFGRNEHLYPYNLKLSPFKERDETKRVIRFKDKDTKCDEFIPKKPTKYIKDKTVQYNIRSDDLESSDSNTESDFIWAKNPAQCDGCCQKRIQDTGSECEVDFSMSTEGFRLKSKQSPNLRPYSEETCYNKTNKSNQKTENIYDFDSIEKNIKSACNSLEASVNQYDSYLRKPRNSKSDTRTPTEYLHHLINLRREAVKLEYPEYL